MSYIYEPQEDSMLLLESVNKYVKSGSSVLEIGTGSGILANAAAQISNSVVTVDINKDAVLFCKEKQKKGVLSKNIKFNYSDLFSKLKGKFDLVIFNPPYLPEDKREPSDVALTTTGGKRGYELSVKFIESVGEYLEKNGKVLLLISTLTGKERIEESLVDNLFDFKIVGEQKIPYETIYVYLIEKNHFLRKLEAKGVSKISKLTHGHRGLIYTGLFEGKKVAIKRQREDIDAVNTVNNEIEKLKQLNKEKIGPSLLFYGNNYFVYRFVEGEMILDALENRSKQEVKQILIELLRQCYVLDQLGLNKEEMHHPVKHVLVGKNEEVVLIDFERCKNSKKVKNVTQCCQFICSGLMKQVLDKKKIVIDKDQVLNAAKEYKKAVSDEKVESITTFINDL